MSIQHAVVCERLSLIACRAPKPSISSCQPKLKAASLLGHRGPARFTAGIWPFCSKVMQAHSPCLATACCGHGHGPSWKPGTGHTSVQHFPCYIQRHLGGFFGACCRQLKSSVGPLLRAETSGQAHSSQHEQSLASCIGHWQWTLLQAQERAVVL